MGTMTMLRCVTAGVGVNTLSTGDLCSNGTKPRKGESVVWGWPLVWEHILPLLETSNEGELSFPSASNGVENWGENGKALQSLSSGLSSWKSDELGSASWRQRCLQTF